MCSFVNNSRSFQDPESVLRGVCHMVAVEIAHDPQVRQATREAYYSKAKVTIRPTKKGWKEIEEMSSLSGLAYVTNKPVTTLKGDQYLHISKVWLTESLRPVALFSFSVDYEFSGSWQMPSCEHRKLALLLFLDLLF